MNNSLVIIILTSAKSILLYQKN